MTESVDHPAHYGGEDNPYEAIKVIEAWGLGFSLGNTVKYISRAGKKDPEKLLQDLKKAAWYLNREISKAELAQKQKAEHDALTSFRESLDQKITTAPEARWLEVHYKALDKRYSSSTGVRVSPSDTVDAIIANAMAQMSLKGQYYAELVSNFTRVSLPGVVNIGPYFKNYIDVGYELELVKM